MMSARIAVQLREQGLDVQAVVERHDMATYPDEALFAVATREEHTMVTKNIVDFGRLSQQWAKDARSHAGLVFINTKSFPRPRTGSAPSRQRWHMRASGDNYQCPARLSRSVAEGPPAVAQPATGAER
jgi:hypothetical protein